jgi:hypothetical protein
VVVGATVVVVEGGVVVVVGGTVDVGVVLSGVVVSGVVVGVVDGVVVSGAVTAGVVDDDEPVVSANAEMAGVPISSIVAVVATSAWIPCLRNRFRRAPRSRVVRRPRSVTVPPMVLPLRPERSPP